MVTAAQNLLAGNLVAFPTETVYGLGADACNAGAVALIYSAKGRPADHPLIVHVASMDALGDWADDVPAYAISLARDFWPGPMTLIVKRSELAGDFVTGGQDTVGVRVPNHPVALGLLKLLLESAARVLQPPVLIALDMFHLRQQTLSKKSSAITWPLVIKFLMVVPAK